MEPTDDELYDIFGPRNSHWVRKWVEEVLTELEIPRLTPELRKVVEGVLLRVFPVTAGTPIGLLIAFELSKTTSQAALNSGHILDSMADPSLNVSSIRHSFDRSLCFTGIISQRKCKSTIFMRCTFQSPPPAHWLLMEDRIYAIPIKEIDQAVAQTTRLEFITQPYLFENEFVGFISNMNMYNYLATRDDHFTLLPFLHMLALVSCQLNPPASYTRHGLKRRNVDFIRRSSFEDVLSAILDGSLEESSVTSETVTGALMTATQSQTGSTYFDLLQKLG